MNYTYEPSEPEIYNGKRFLVTPETGAQFMVSVFNDESEIPALVEITLNPPPQAPYPPQEFNPTLEQQIIYDHENRLREIEGEPPLSMKEFARTYGL